MTEITKKDIHSLRMMICDELEKENKDYDGMIALLEHSNEYLKEFESIKEPEIPEIKICDLIL